MDSKIKKRFYKALFYKEDELKCERGKKKPLFDLTKRGILYKTFKPIR